ncbi:protein kinase domain-containing protein [Kitasatospora paranensis]|uniref:Protein kinase n=1 Tax=Kitasatospora paranensis TaxID=258053 RepID=A0ABW2G4F9_9ACTN
MEPLREDDPELIGPYRLFALLGRGGWGNVYFARPEYGRAVALKTIRPDRLEEDPERFRSRFAREVEAARVVGSACTAEVVDADTRAAEPWFAARYIPGVDLATALDLHGGPLPRRTWRVLAAGLVDALRSIHAAGLVHRDLKLANILLAATGPAVIDFGIARQLSPDAGTTLTATGFAPRTLTFASPEQLRDERVGPAGDVFALGLVLAYAALARHPFGPGSATQIGVGILQGRPRLDGLPPDIAKVVRACLEPQTRNRPGLDELSALLPADGSPKGHEWLSPELRGAVDERAGTALDLAEPIRPRRGAPARPAPARVPTTGPPADRRSDRTSASPAPAREGATTLPPVAAPPRAVPGAAPPTADRPAPARPAAAKPTGPGAKFRAEADAGDSEAMRRLAAAHQQAGDRPSALHWYLRSAEAGNATGAREAAHLIEKHFPEQQRQVPALYRRAAEAGDLHAAMRLGELLEQEPGGLEEALPWFERAAVHNYGKSRAAVLRVRSAVSLAAVPAAERAVLREHRAAALEGQIDAILALGNWYQKEKRPQDALLWYWRAAEAGHPHSMLLTGQLLAKDPQRQAEALDWYHRSAAAGNTEALYWLGQRLRAEGRRPEALARLRQAAEKDHAPSAFAVAELVEQNGQEDRAREWYERAAAKGHPGAAQEAERIRAALAWRATGPKATKTATPKPAAAPAAAKPATPKPATPKPATSKSAAKKAKRPVADLVAAARTEARAHEQAGRLEDAVRCYTQAEQLSDQASKWDVARLCLRLRDRASDTEEQRRLRKRALRRYRELAATGDVRAMQALVEHGAHDANHWQVQAAEAGSTKAMRAVARVRLDRGGEDNVRAALVWLHRAGQAGSAAAAMDGARIHEQRGAHRDALDWYRWAVANGDKSAAQHVTRLETAHPGVALWQRVSDRLRRTWG